MSYHESAVIVAAEGTTMKNTTMRYLLLSLLALVALTACQAPPASTPGVARPGPTPAAHDPLVCVLYEPGADTLVIEQLASGQDVTSDMCGVLHNTLERHIGETLALSITRLSQVHGYRQCRLDLPLFGDLWMELWTTKRASDADLRDFRQTCAALQRNLAALG